MRALLPRFADDPDVHAHYARDWVARGGVRVNFVSAADGAVTADGKSKGLQTPGDNRVFAALRDLADVVLVGAGTAVAELVAMNEAVQNGDAQKGREIWERLAPVARYCWRAPIRDFRPRMKEILRLQGLIADGAVRRPQLGISANEKDALAHLARTAGLI